MIFLLDVSLRNTNNENVEAHFIDFIDGLCSARRNGRHIIYSDVGTLETLMGLDAFGVRTKATLRKISKKVRLKRELFESCETYVRVVSAVGTFEKILLAAGKEEIRISTDRISGDDIFSKTRFVVENRTDGLFYASLAAMSMDRVSSLRDVNLVYEIIAGGGSQTPREYSVLRATEYLTLCMVDSDVDYFEAPLGLNTAQPIFDLDSKDPPVFSKSLILNCYSAENLIHPEILKRATGISGKEPWYERVKDYYNKDFWMFLALKTKKTCSDFNPGDKKTTFWSSKRRDFVEAECAPVCDPKTCKIYEPLKGKTLEKVSDFLAEKDYSFLSEIDFDDHKIFDEWNKISMSMLAWCCSGGRLGSM